MVTLCADGVAGVFPQRDLLYLAALVPRRFEGVREERAALYIFLSSFLRPLPLSATPPAR